MTFKNIATVYSFFLTLEQTLQLNLKEQQLIISLPKSLVRKLGITSDSPKFDIIIHKGVVSLVRSVPPAQRADTAPKDDQDV